MTHMHAVSLLIHFESVRNFAFDPVRTKGGGSKTKFRTIINHVITKSSKFRSYFEGTIEKYAFLP